VISTSYASMPRCWDPYHCVCETGTHDKCGTLLCLMPYRGVHCLWFACVCFFGPPPPRVRVGEALRKGLYLALQMVAGGAHETPAHTPRPHPG
jgi:hypothetical protein